MTGIRKVIFYALAVLSAVDASQTCYALNGDAVSYDYVPCNQFSGATSYCCGANRSLDNLSFTPDKCLTDGLCLAVAQVNGREKWTYFRESCSSPDWPTANCLRDVCTSPNENDANGNAFMTPCDNITYSNTWCCGDNNTACCGTDSAITLAVTLGATATLSSTSSSPTTATLSSTSSSPTTASSTATASASASSTSSTDSSLSIGAQAGIGIGATIAGLSLVSLGVLWFMRRRRASRSTSPHDPSSLMGSTLASSKAQVSYRDYEGLGQKPDGLEEWHRPTELDSYEVGELDSHSLRELDGNNHDARP
ncbi:unnamed protein product [Aureobasidium mustum]|uniref:Mid2 domain-containing protein n=1 Tax=Aureobasidium mustum TaxID=2773714 RepID=A0A9N8JXQ9_9PEZI|nr:unnamed protein product [Aureobasidium mustum]